MTDSKRPAAVAIMEQVDDLNTLEVAVALKTTFSKF